MTPTLPAIETLNIRTPLRETDLTVVSESENLQDELALRAELCLWVKSLSYFLDADNSLVTSSDWKIASSHNWRNELQITRWALLRISHLTNQIFDLLHKKENFNLTELTVLTGVLREAAVAADSISIAPKIDLHTWKLWSGNLNRNLRSSEAFTSLQINTDRDLRFPNRLQELLKLPSLGKHADHQLFETFKKILALIERLYVIEDYLQHDKPLKPTLLLFVLIQHETRELLNYIENRVLRDLSTEHEYFDLLDGTIYIISLEIRKVYTRELTGVSAIRPAPALFARIETAYGLLLDCLQQSVVALAQTLNPDLQNFQIFPNFKIKLEQSLSLRLELWRLLQIVQKAEREAAVCDLNYLKEKAHAFKFGAMKFLMYKDCEPTERFIEEILHSHKIEEIDHLLHRFAAYLETLLGQVNMRTVLADHPFDYPQD